MARAAPTAALPSDDQPDAGPRPPRTALSDAALRPPSCGRRTGSHRRHRAALVPRRPGRGGAAAAVHRAGTGAGPHVDRAALGAGTDLLTSLVSAVVGTLRHAYVYGQAAVGAGGGVDVAAVGVGHGADDG